VPRGSWLKPGVVAETEYSDNLLSSLMESVSHRARESERIEVMTVSKLYPCCGMTSMLQVVAWKLQNIDPFQAKCFFVNENFDNSQESALIKFGSEQTEAWVVIFADDDIKEETVEHMLHFLKCSNLRLCTVVNVYGPERKCSLRVGPFMQIDSVQRVKRALRTVFGEELGSVDCLIAFIRQEEGAAMATERSSPLPDSHIYIVILTAFRGKFEPILQIVHECLPEDVDQRNIVFVLALLSAFCSNVSLRKSCFRDKPETAHLEVCGSRFGQLFLRQVPTSFVSVLHPFIATICLQRQELFEVWRSFESSMTSMSMTSVEWKQLAKSLLITRLKGDELSPLVTSFTARGCPRKQMFEIIDRVIGKHIDEADRVIFDVGC
jgi:hypothetical protein